MVIRIISHSLKYLDLRCLEWVKKGTISESSFYARVGWTEISEINSGNCQYLPISDVFFRDSWGHLQRNGSSSGRSTPAPLLRQAPTRHVTAVSVLSSTCLSKQPGIWPNLPCFLNLHCAVCCTKWHTSVFHRFHLVSLHRISENNGTSPTSTPWFYGHGTLDARAIITLDW